MTWYLVRHGRPLQVRGVPASAWELDPAGFDAVWELRPQLPQDAAWYCSPEPKAVGTAQLLTEGDVGILDGLREQVRGGTWVADFTGAVQRAFQEPEQPAVPGWEPLAATRERVLRAVGSVRAAHPAGDVVLVGHGTAWTLVVAALTGGEPDLGAWSRLGMPGVLRLEEPLACP